MFAAVKEGVVKVLLNPDTSKDSHEILDISNKVCSNGERGMFQVLAHPDFLNRRVVYISYVYNKYGGCQLDSKTGAVNRLSKFDVHDDFQIEESSEVVLVETSPTRDKMHNGGDILFGNDGYLYWTMGDGGDPSASQDLSNLLATVMRLTEDGDIPPDNPFLGEGTARCHKGPQPGKICQEIFVYGFRNPYRFSLNPNTPSATSQFFIGDVGGETWEEISIIDGKTSGGSNYGWSTREGPCRRGSYTSCDQSDDDMVDPIFWYGHNGGGAALTGIAVIPDGLWPAEYDGSLFHLEFVQGEIWVIWKNETSPCRSSCNRPVPEWSRYLFHNLEDSNVARAAQLVFGPYKDTIALYYTTRMGDLNIRRITYQGIRNRSPIANISVDTLAALVNGYIAFDARHSSDPDDHELTFLWEFGDGSTSNLARVSHLFSSSGNFNVILTVTDPFGFVGQASVVVDIGRRPTAIINSPTEGTTFSVGDIFTLVGSAMDGNGKWLEDSFLTWEVRQHHNTHYHPFMDPTVGNRIILDPAPPPEDFLAAATTYLEVILTAKDSQGFFASTSLILNPKTIILDFESAPSGMELLIDDFPVITPASIVSWKNHVLSLKAVDQDGLYFQRWSDGDGKRDRVIVLDSSRGEKAFFVSCKLAWTECTNNHECCTGKCRYNKCRPVLEEQKDKLGGIRGGAGGTGARNNNGRVRG